MPDAVADQLVLHRFSVKPHHLDVWRAAWPEEVALRRRHGFTWHRAFVETHAEPKVTWLYSHPDPAAGEASLTADPAYAALVEHLRPHVFRNVLVRPVRGEIVTDRVTARLAIMRRYAITGGWEPFLAIWRRIVAVRAAYGFDCLFAVVDESANLFTWAFDFAGTWEEFADAQKPYYRDPARVELRGVFDHMADYQITPAEQLRIPPGDSDLTGVDAPETPH